MTLITCHYRGGLRCEAEHGPSGHRISTDAPTDNQGRGESFSPTDLVATALATCILTVMGIAAERRGWNLEGTEARVEKTMTREGVRRIAQLTVWVRLPDHLDGAARDQLQRFAEGCPVKRSLEGSVAMEIIWE